MTSKNYTVTELLERQIDYLHKTREEIKLAAMHNDVPQFGLEATLKIEKLIFDVTWALREARLDEESKKEKQND